MTRRAIPPVLVLFLVALAAGGLAVGGSGAFVASSPVAAPVPGALASGSPGVPGVAAGTSPSGSAAAALGLAAPHPATSSSGAGAVFRWVAGPANSPVVPPARSGGAFVFDPDLNESILFGGQSSGGGCFSDTWAFANGNWTNLTAGVIGEAPAVASASAAYDPPLAGIVVFGGHPCGSTSYSNSTWLFHADRWTNLTSAAGTAPPPLAGALMTYDATDGYDLLFGGLSGAVDSVVADTWAFANGSWSNLTDHVAGGPPAGCCGGMVYDPGLGAVLAGYVPAGSMSGAEFWEYADAVWTPVEGPSAATDLSSLSLGPAPAANASVLFAGTDGATGNGSTTWLYRDGNWTNLTGPAGPGPSSRSAAMLAHTGAPGAVVLFGGYNRTTEKAYGDTWVLEYAVPPEVTVVASARDAEVGVPINFTAEPQGAASGPFAYAWSFGDGAQATGNQSTHSFAATGNYTVRVGITDTATHFTNTSTVIIHIVPGPAIAADVIAPTVDAGATDTFVASASFGAPPMTFAWAFGDGGTAGGAEVGHAFASPGNYSVTVTVTDSEGATGTERLPVRVVSPPAVAIVVPSLGGDVGVPVAFAPVVEGGVGPYTFLWSFGDGTLRASMGVNHSFAAPGRYPVSVSVRDVFGLAARATTTVAIVPAPTLAVEANVTATDAGLPVEFHAGVANGTAPYAISWSFGNAATASGSGLTVAFALPGVYPVTADLVDAAGAVVRQSMNLAVHAPPTLALSVAPTTVPVGRPVVLTVQLASGTAPFAVNWTLGDGGYASGAFATHTFALPGVYPLTLEVTDAAGWHLTRSVNVTVVPAGPVPPTPGGTGPGSAPSAPDPGVPAAPIVLALAGGAGVGLLVALIAVGSWHRRRAARGPRSPLDEPVGVPREEPIGGGPPLA